MITENTYYGIDCDKCGVSYETSCGHSVMDEANCFVSWACDDGWYSDDDKHYCPDCHMTDEDDNLIIT